MGTDLVFNYGTFEFGPDFYEQFIRGKLLYFLSVQDFGEFMYDYRIESRSVQEQLLELGCAAKQRLYQALRLNAQEPNRYYKYDFLFDNCTTRAGVIVAANADSTVIFHRIVPDHAPSFRDLIHSYLDAGHENWSRLGIDILLGVKVDRPVTNREAMFLPDYLMKGFDKATVGDHALAARPQTILQLPSPLAGGPIVTPFLFFTILLLLSAGLNAGRSRWLETAAGILDFVLFFGLGIAGLLIMFMWLGTDHVVCRDNYNLWWALPTHVVMAFFVRSTRAWVQTYFRAVFWMTVVLAVTWAFLPQQMNNALLPVIFLILYRTWHLSKLKLYARKGDHT